MLEAPGHALAHVRALVEELERVQDEVAEVERAALRQQAVVVGIEAGELEPPWRRRCEAASSQAAAIVRSA